MFRFSWQSAKAAIGQRHERRDGLPPERDLAHLYMRNASVLSEESPQSQWDLGCCCLVSKEVSLQAEAARCSEGTRLAEALSAVGVLRVFVIFA